jgi:hypothetical protein
MANLNDPNVRIQYIVDVDGFRTALYFEPAEFDALTDKQVETLATERIDAFKNRPIPEPVILTKEDLTLKAEALQAELDAIYAQEPDLKQLRIDVLTGKKDAKGNDLEPGLDEIALPAAKP